RRFRRRAGEKWPAAPAMRVIASSKSSCGEEPKPAAAPSPRPVTVVTMTKVRAPSPQPLSRYAGEGLQSRAVQSPGAEHLKAHEAEHFKAPLLRSGRGRCEAPGEGPAFPHRRRGAISRCDNPHQHAPAGP